MVRKQALLAFVALASQAAPALAAPADAAGRPRRGLQVPFQESGRITALAFNPSSTLLALGTESERVQLWELGTRRRQDTWRASNGPVSALAFSHDGARVISAGFTGGVQLRDVGSHRLAATYGDRSAPLACLALSPDGKTVATGGWGVSLWDATGGTARTVQDRTRYAYGLAYSGDGKLLAAAGHDGTVTLWDWRQARQRITLLPLPGREWAGFTPDGRFEVSPGGLGMVSFFDGDRVYPVEEFEHRYRAPGLWARIMAGRPEGSETAHG